MAGADSSRYAGPAGQPCFGPLPFGSFGSFGSFGPGPPGPCPSGPGPPPGPSFFGPAFPSGWSAVGDETGGCTPTAPAATPPLSPATPETWTETGGVAEPERDRQRVAAGVRADQVEPGDTADRQDRVRAVRDRLEQHVPAVLPEPGDGAARNT